MKIDDVLATLRRARREQRALRVLLVPAHDQLLDEAEQPDDRRPDAAPALEGVPERHHHVERRVRRCVQGRQAPSGDDPDADAEARRARRRTDPPRVPQRSRLHQPAPRPVLGDGVRDPARARTRGDRGHPQADRRERLQHQLPDRGARRRAGRHPAVAGARPRHLLHRRPPVQGDGLQAVLPRGRGADDVASADVRTGGSSTSGRRRTCVRRTRASTTSSRCATGSTRRACSATTTSTACSAPLRRRR